MLPVLLDREDHAKTSCAFIKLKPKEFHKTFSFLFSFKLWRGNNRYINDNDNDNDLIDPDYTEA